MQPAFWRESWQLEGTKTSFHRPDIHPYVLDYAPPPFLAGKRVFVPLAGKTNDLDYFRRHADYTVGVELVEKPIRQFFEEHDLLYATEGDGVFRTAGMKFLQRDLFELTPEDVGPVDFVYDRASLIAFPEDMRRQYLRKMDELTGVGSRTLLITLEYAPLLDEPPFSLGAEEIRDYYGEKYDIEHVEWPERPGHGMQRKYGLDYVREHGFWLTKRRP